MFFFFLYDLCSVFFSFFFFFNDTATTEIYTLSLHDALPISPSGPSNAGSPTIGIARTSALTSHGWSVTTRSCTLGNLLRSLGRAPRAAPPGQWSAVYFGSGASGRRRAWLFRDARGRGARRRGRPGGVEHPDRRVEVAARLL